MIIFFIDKYDLHTLHMVSFLSDNMKYNYVILTKFNRGYFDRAEVIIPFGIKSQQKLIKYSSYKNKYLLCDNARIYDQLDDKIIFYDLIIKYDLLYDSSVHLIPTYDSKFSHNKYGKFILKQRDGSGSLGNIFKTGYLRDLIEKYSSKYQIQDVIDIKNIYSISCFCIKGEVINSINYITNGYLNPDFYRKRSIDIIQAVNSSIGKVIDRIVKKFNYNGIIEIEFIVDHKDKIYLMEVNPRISGTIKTKTENGYLPFNNFIIDAYILYITKKKVPSIKLCDWHHGKKYNVINYSYLPGKKYYFADDSVIKFD